MTWFYGFLDDARVTIFPKSNFSQNIFIIKGLILRKISNHRRILTTNIKVTDICAAVFTPLTDKSS